jgi:hypothetical protein
MSGDDADPVLVAAVLDSFVKELRGRYEEAKFGSDPVGRRAYGSKASAGVGGVGLLGRQRQAGEGEPRIHQREW